MSIKSAGQVTLESLNAARDARPELHRPVIQPGTPSVDTYTLMNQILSTS